MSVVDVEAPEGFLSLKPPVRDEHADKNCKEASTVATECEGECIKTAYLQQAKASARGALGIFHNISDLVS